MKCKEDRDIRLFAAVELEEHTKRRLQKVVDELSDVDAKVKWVDPSKVHLTIVFLGETPAGSLERVKTCVDRAAGSVDRFNCSLAGMGYFGSRRSPRVIWAGLRGDMQTLHKLRNSLAGELEKEKIDFDRKDFRPHVTLGRVKSRKGADKLVEKLDRMQEVELGTLETENIVLIQSVLKPGGALHTPVHEASLSAE